MSYGTFLPWLENALNDVEQCKTGLRSMLMKQLVANFPGVEQLTKAEVAISYKYHLPVHAVGYNWLRSNTVSAGRLERKIQEFIEHYRRQGKKCDCVIIVTHSMGGLVSRYYSECIGGREKILGIVHGVMPATGSATAYKRVKGGTEGTVGIALGSDAAQMTAVFAQAPGPLQLLPSPEYGMGWLKIRDRNEIVSMPRSNPYDEIYTVRGRWWSLCDDKLLNPLDRDKRAIDDDWKKFCNLISNEVVSFHSALCCEGKRGRYHQNTYAFYGDDAAHKTWGDVFWDRKVAGVGLRDSILKIEDLTSGTVLRDSGEGEQYLCQESGGISIRTNFVMRGAGDNGDWTVPVRSGAAPRGSVKICVPYPAVDHEGAYKEYPQQLFALWAVTKILSSVANTSMAYSAK